MLARLTHWIGLLAVISACGASAVPTAKVFNSVDRFPWPEASATWERKPVMDELEFRTIIHRVLDPYQKLAAVHQASIALRIPVEAQVSTECLEAKDEDAILRCSWQSSLPNADAGRSRKSNIWYIGIGGGLARLPAMTPEGLTMVLCHELGHLFGGFPFQREGFTGLALPISVEGQSDYFAAQVCVRKIWAQDDNLINSEGVAYESMIEAEAVKQCQAMYEPQGERELCYKTIFASMSFVKALGKMRDEDAAPSVSTPDKGEIGMTDNAHPAAQCRLDTFIAGALCPTILTPVFQSSAVTYDETRIPAYDAAAPGGKAARDISLTVSCHKNFIPEGARPRCWFNPELTQEGGWMNEI